MIIDGHILFLLHLFSQPYKYLLRPGWDRHWALPTAREVGAPEGDKCTKSLGIIITFILVTRTPGWRSHVVLCLFNNFTEVWLLDKELHIFDVYNLMNLYMCKHLSNHHHSQGNRHTHRLPEFPLVLSFLFVCDKNTSHETYPFNKFWSENTTLFPGALCYTADL